MAIKKALILVIFIFVVSLPFLQSSTSSRIYQTNMAGSGSIPTNKEVARFGNEAASAGIVEDSARDVPTGPDPLHHNNHPIGH